MNYRIILRTLGLLLIFEAAFMLVPTITALVYQETQGWHFVLAMAICALVGFLGLRVKVKNPSIYSKEGFMIVALSWIVMSLFGALPFWTSKSIPSYIDALFEMVSGFTTTGSSILNGEQIESLSKCMLMWRSFSHWIGGMGVIVFIMVFIPLSGGRNIHLIKAKSPKPSVGKLVPKVRSTARILYLLYAALTIIEIVLLSFDAPLFDSITIAFSTAGTGGFAIRGDSLLSYSNYVHIIVTIFMLLFAVNFSSYFFLLCRRFKEAFNSEVKVFFAIVFVAIIASTCSVYFSAENTMTIWQTLKHVAFSVASIISTTGFCTVDFALWPIFAGAILVLLMFIGACAGSTGGGIKVSRVIILYKGATHEMRRWLHPKQIKTITMDGRTVDEEVVRGVNAYIVAYLLIFITSVLLLCLDFQDLLTNFTAIAATLNNIGPGLGAVGPTGNFAFYSIGSKLILIFNMLAGRLEIFPMLLLITPITWRK